MIVRMIELSIVSMEDWKIRKEAKRINVHTTALGVLSHNFLNLPFPSMELENNPLTKEDWMTVERELEMRASSLTKFQP